jgi:DNA-binding transcriptional regulator YhcF (GntR family)
LKSGDALPSIRQLANDLDLNSRIVAKAYQLLTRDSIIETKGYRGTYVHPKAKANCSSTCRNGSMSHGIRSRGLQVPSSTSAS